MRPISVVIPLIDEAESLPQLMEEVAAVAAGRAAMEGQLAAQRREAGDRRRAVERLGRA